MYLIFNFSIRSSEQELKIISPSSVALESMQKHAGEWNGPVDLFDDAKYTSDVFTTKSF
jgi:hypothetical protein